MSTESPPELMEKPTKNRRARVPPLEIPAQSVLAIPAGRWVLDRFLLALTFLLGAFPLKDTDFYWHFRTGDLIRQTGHVPRTDLFTFTREGVPWIDLHWIFQIAISWVYQHGGVVALNLAKCIVTCVAMLSW